uniref:hypothetical protein n=1 Tax=Nanhaiella sioensis TaxID=3115293 RepID=UPI00397A112C
MPDDGNEVTLLELKLPEYVHGRQVKIDGSFQSNFFIGALSAVNDTLPSQPVSYKFVINYRLAAMFEGNRIQVSPILADTVSGVQLESDFQVEHSTAPNFTFGMNCLTADTIFLMASAAECKAMSEMRLFGLVL